MKENKILLYMSETDKAAKLLSDEGYDVTCVSDEGSAVDMLMDKSFDIFIAENEMPGGFLGLNMVIFAKMIREKDKPFIIATTVYNLVRLNDHFIDAGADALIQTSDLNGRYIPFRLKRLLERRPIQPDRHFAADRRKRTCDEVYKYLIELGYDEIKGTKYLSEAVTEVLYRATAINQLMKGLYLKIAEENGTSVSAVERCIRFSIHKVTDKTPTEVIYQVTLHMRKLAYPL